MALLFSQLPIEVENIIAKNVEYKKDFKKVIADINRIGENIDYEFELNNAYQCEYTQLQYSDLWWECLLDAIDGIVSENAFNNEHTNSQLYEKEFNKLYSFYN